MTTSYEANGFKSREDYLASLREEYPAAAVNALADVLGPSEDFDGLVTALEDIDDCGDLGDWEF